MVQNPLYNETLLDSSAGKSGKLESPKNLMFFLGNYYSPMISICFKVFIIHLFYFFLISRNKKIPIMVLLPYHYISNGF